MVGPVFMGCQIEPVLEKELSCRRNRLAGSMTGRIICLHDLDIEKSTLSNGLTLRNVEISHPIAAGIGSSSQCESLRTLSRERHLQHTHTIIPGDIVMAPNNLPILGNRLSACRKQAESETQVTYNARCSLNLEYQSVILPVITAPASRKKTTVVNRGSPRIG